ncbi:Uncharacterized protein FKW44_000474 [Caligus rogercresseyi]|uniref:Tc1-like transposase DDE domain-containing protein n=1 Tax=Caligus rogercresseyi TaxID=217165 RepID=A0A7T8KHD6_CALRO|nr:Uncharacterized protein FKW44_000474 [Caligus rogercresseyi]
MEQARRDTILELALAGHKPAAIYKLLNYPKTTVYRVFNAWEAEGKVCHKTHNMRSDKICTPRFFACLEKSTKALPGTSLSRLDKNHGVSKQLVSKAVNEDLGYRSYRMAKQHILTASMKATRLTNGKRLINGLKSHGGRIIFFSDEKNWTVGRSYNVQNDRWLAKEREEVPAVFTTKFPASVVTLGVICSTGEVMPPFFFNPKERVNAERYCEVMEEVVIPWMKDNAAGRDTRTHRPQDHQSLQLSRHHILRSEHLALQLARPQSVEVCKVSHNSIEALKNSITREWNAVDPAEVIRACKCFRGRMEKMVAAEGGHIE